MKKTKLFLKEIHTLERRFDDDNPTDEYIFEGLKEEGGAVQISMVWGRMSNCLLLPNLRWDKEEFNYYFEMDQR